MLPRLICTRSIRFASESLPPLRLNLSERYIAQQKPGLGIVNLVGIEALHSTRLRTPFGDLFWPEHTLSMKGERSCRCS